MITGHVFRRYHGGGNDGRRDGSAGGPAITDGMCWYMTRCDRPESEHLTRDEYRERRRR